MLQDIETKNDFFTLCILIIGTKQENVMKLYIHSFKNYIAKWQNYSIRLNTASHNNLSLNTLPLMECTVYIVNQKRMSIISRIIMVAHL